MLEENNNFEQNQTEYKYEYATPQPETAVVPATDEYIFDCKRRKKREIRRLAMAVGIPCLCLSLIGFLWGYVYLFFTERIFGMSYTDAVKLSQDSAMQQILQIILSCLMFLLPFSVAAKCVGVRIDNTVRFGKPRQGTALPFLFFGIGFCSFANIAMSYSSAIFESIGIDYDVDFGDNPSGIFGFLLSFIATAVVPALVEEFACRGIVLGLLKPHGESFAIVTSAIVFGVMHGNFEQIPFAVMIGLVLGYIYVKTDSIWVCVAVHGANNAISVIFGYLDNMMTSNMQNLLYLVYLIFSMLLAILGVFLFAKNGDENYALKKSENETFENYVIITQKQKYNYFFTSWAIILFIAFNIIESLTYFVV